MIDLINGIIKNNRFNLDKQTTKNNFAKKYVPNYIKENTYYYNPPGIQIGDFVAQWSSVSFKSNGAVDVVNFTFESDNKDFFKDEQVIELFKPLVNNLFANKQDMQMYWQMPYGEVMLSWACWPSKNAFIIEIHYNHWDYIFDIKNSFVDIAWGLIKTEPLDACCLTKLRHELVDNDVRTERCKLYANNKKCSQCSTQCDLIKCWNVHNQPTYKELLHEVEEHEFIENDILISSNHVKLNGLYHTLNFELRKNKNQYEILIDGDSEKSYYDTILLLEIMDKFAHISSAWYKNFKLLT